MLFVMFRLGGFETQIEGDLGPVVLAILNQYKANPFLQVQGNESWLRQYQLMQKAKLRRVLSLVQNVGCLNVT